MKIRGESALNFYLIFYDPVTPQEYEPPGFKPSTCTDFQYEEEPVTINVGDVATVRYLYSCKLSSCEKKRIYFYWYNILTSYLNVKVDFY